EELAAAFRARIAGVRLADVGEPRVVVAPGLDPAQMPPVAVRAGDELALAQRLIGDDVDRHSERTERPAARAVDGPDLLVGRGTVGLAERRHELLLVEAVVAADQRQYRPLRHHHGHRLRGLRRVDAADIVYTI